MKTNTFSEKLDNILKQIFEQPVVRKQAKSAIIDLVLNDVIGADEPENLVNGETHRVWFIRGMNEARSDARAVIKGGNHED